MVDAVSAEVATAGGEGAEPELIVTDDDHVRTFTLNRPHRRNALSPSLHDALLEASAAAIADPDVWVMVYTGTGTAAFCAGGDLVAMTQTDRAGGPPPNPVAGSRRMLFELIAESPKPTIAAINGSAVAGGFELVLACDMRIASEDARLGLPEAKRGMGANFASVVLPRVVPPAIAYEMLFTGEYVTAAEAARWGLVNRVVPPERVAEESAALARQIADNAPVSIRRMKEMATKSAALPLTAAVRLDVGPNPYLSEDRKEGVAAFVEKRKPVWRNR